MSEQKREKQGDHEGASGICSVRCEEEEGGHRTAGPR